jgi:phosphoribosylamine--glycine ligase
VKVLVVGSGGREHALAWCLQRQGADVLVAPGNGGTPKAFPVGATDVAGLRELAMRERIDLTIVGPEGPLAMGIVDAFAERELAVFGPTRAAARLEWSKGWAKDFFRRHGIPTASAEIVGSEGEARRALARLDLPAVLKADGLAAGKGVFVVHSAEEADAAFAQLFGHLGAAAQQVLVEQCLAGPELSLLAFSDGERLAVMPPARDYKRLRDDDGGPNTGGMGGLTWPSYATSALLDDVEQHILRPTLDGMAAEGTPYRGVLYAGLMLTADGPKVLEFNCRFGDPECQLILPLLVSPLAEVCAQVASGSLRPSDLHWASGRTFGVVLAAPGYPDAPRLGEPIFGLDELPDGVLAFHAGTRRDAGGRLLTAGGRVLTVVGSDRSAVYAAAETIRFAGKQFRRDIGRDEANHIPGAGEISQESRGIAPRDDEISQGRRSIDRSDGEVSRESKADGVAAASARGGTL